MDMTRTTLTKLNAVRGVVYSRSRITGKGNPGKKPQNLRADVKLPNIVVQAAKPFKIRRVKIGIRPPNSLSRRTAPRDVERSFTRVPHGPQSAVNYSANINLSQAILAVYLTRRVLQTNLVRQCPGRLDQFFRIFRR